MVKTAAKLVFILIIIFTGYRCIDPYSPKLSGYSSLLVVDGLLTDADASYSVKLSRTFQDQASAAESVDDAVVTITDDQGNSARLGFSGKGVYKTDSTAFRGSPGRTYTLHILTHEGEEYTSSKCFMHAVDDIDSLYYEKDIDYINNGTQAAEGIRIFLNSKQGDQNQYYRWSFNETWKFKVPNPKRYNFNPADSTITLIRDIKDYCYKFKSSDAIIVESLLPGSGDRISREPIIFISGNGSDRLMLQYSIEVNQYSISDKEYDFWNNLKQINDGGGDIFAKQPFTVISNITNINNPKERVLGYFQVSAVKKRRLNIPFSDIVKLKLPFYHYSCERVIKKPADYQTEWGPKVTWTDLYNIFCKTSDYYFIEPIYNTDTGLLEQMVFTRPECANCEVTGTRVKPDYWTDPN